VRSLFDVNLLMALFQPEHTHYDRAQSWWGENQAGGWASCPLTQNGFVRIVSRSAYPKPLVMATAVGILAEQTSATDHAFWSDEISILDPRLFNHSRILGPNQITDIYLLALAVKNDGRLATLDRSIPIAAVRGAEQRHIVVI
jgi:toxin-antitoxin system PIN domain toxin